MAVIKKRQKNDIQRKIKLSKTSDITDASDVLKQASAQGITTTPLDITTLIKAYNIQLKRRPLDDDISGHLAFTDDGWVMTVNSLHHPRRQRFTLAHELGHYILHSNRCHDFVDKMLFRSSERSPVETEANRFAASLLMPENDFRNFSKTVSSKVEDIAEHFSVSPLAVRVRAKELGFTGHGLD